MPRRGLGGALYPGEVPQGTPGIFGLGDYFPAGYDKSPLAGALV